MTKYVVLNRKAQPANAPSGLTGWIQLSGEYEGSNAKAAIQAALKSGNGSGDPSGEYVAVPARSWDPVKVEAKQAFSFS